MGAVAAAWGKEDGLLHPWIGSGLCCGEEEQGGRWARPLAAEEAIACYRGMASWRWWLAGSARRAPDGEEGHREVRQSATDEISIHEQERHRRWG
jgi:hypothetical protein